MSVVNLSPFLKTLIDEFDKRIRKLEQPPSMVVPSLSSDPAIVYDGMVWYRTSDHKFMSRDNGATRPLGEMKYYASFYDTTTQTIGSTASSYAVKMNTTAESNGVTIDATRTKISVPYTGQYNVQFSLQLENADTSLINDAWIWVKLNNANMAASNTRMSIPNKHSGINGAAVAAWNFVLTLTPTDTFELWWASNSIQVSMPYSASAAGPPAMPSIPSVILSVTQMSW